MANELYRTYEVLVEESMHPGHQKRAPGKTDKPPRFNAEIDGALRDTHMIFQDAVCYNTLCFAGLAGMERNKAGERELLNPLWAHLTLPAAQGGIKADTERVIRRLATHYKPLHGITTANEFLNRVYSEPLQIRDEMPEAEKNARRELRAKCYRILEKFGAPTKENGGQECADMSAFANTWAGLTSKPESDTEIPGNLAYDCVCRELKQTLKEDLASEKAAAVLEETLLRYSAKAEERNKADCSLRYAEELEELRTAVAEVEKLAESEPTRATRLKKAKVVLERHVTGKTKFEQKFFNKRRDGLKSDVKSALAKPFAAEKAADIGLTEEQFAEAKAYVTSPIVAAEADTKGLIRLHYKGGRPGLFELAMFRYWLLRDDENALVRRAALADFRKFIKDDKPDAEPVLDGEPIAKMPFRSDSATEDAKMAFPLFGKKCLGIETTHSSPDWDFDKTAYATAAEDVFKYKIRTAIRKARVQKLLNVVWAYEGAGKSLPPEESPTGKTLNIRGMGGDPRWNGEEENKKGITLLLKKLSEGKDLGGYGLREGTIGGWADVRKKFLALHRGARAETGVVSDENELVKKLVEAVDREMEENRQGFGSPDFFHELCDPAYWHLWLEGAGHERHGVKDFIPHYVGYCEWREELVGLLIKETGEELERETALSAAKMEKLGKKPIRYTWPGLLNRHKKPSYRYYDFAGALNTAFQFKSLFRRVRAKDANGNETLVDKYEKLTGDKTKVTLAARRLKRDQIINKDNGNSVNALWCPPLILAGEANPTSKNKPRAGKEKKKESDDAEVSFSLMASPLPADFWNEVATVPSTKEAAPIHLTVSFKVEGDETSKLRSETKQWLSGSHRGFAKKGEKDADKRRCFNWPIDRETSKFDSDEAQEKAKMLWCGSGKSEDAWKGFVFRQDKKASASKDAAYHESDFQILSIDLGNRFAAAFTRFRIHADANGEGRIISADDFSPVIRAELVREGTLRLQGENAKVWDHVRNPDGTCQKDTKGNYVYALEDEKYGNGGRGRFPTAPEYDAFIKLAGRLVSVKSLTLSGAEKQTYPELGDHLAFRFKRRIGRLRTLFNFTWRLCAKHERNQRTGVQGKERSEGDVRFHQRMTVETLARSAFPKRPRQSGEQEEADDASLRTTLAVEEQWQKLKDGGLLDSLKGAAEKRRRTDLETALTDRTAWKWDALANAVKKQIAEYMEGVPDDAERPPMRMLLVAVIEFCLPLRGRRWGWDPNRQARLNWDKKDEAHVPNLIGMRGLSMKRLEQIMNLRQRCQSYAKLEDRYRGPYKIGDYNPPDSSREELPDTCPLLLERSNRIREQRVDQTAHLILTEALGMELKNPAEVADKKQRKTEADLHGEYQRRKDKNGKPYPRCSVIVLENLERYKMSLGRTKAENSRLMQWAHRAIIEKLEDMCRPFGITLMLVDPAFSSHFDAQTGLPGVRVNQVPRGFEQEHPYRKWINDKSRSGGETQLAKDIKALVKTFADHPAYQGELVLAVEGGKEFVPVLSPKGGEGLINADICAAGNVGLRGVADPQRWDIFPRLRTKQISETEVSVRDWRGWFGKFGRDTEQRRLRAIAAKDDSPAQAEKIKIHLAADKSKPIKGKKAGAAVSSGNGDAAEDADSKSSQSSEYPPFFVEHPDYPKLHDADWLAKSAYQFEQNGKRLHAFPQGAYLKRVERLCAQRIDAINDGRIRNRISLP